MLKINLYILKHTNKVSQIDITLSFRSGKLPANHFGQKKILAKLNYRFHF